MLSSKSSHALCCHHHHLRKTYSFNPEPMALPTEHASTGTVSASVSDTHMQGSNSYSSWPTNPLPVPCEVYRPGQWGHWPPRPNEVFYTGPPLTRPVYDLRLQQFSPVPGQYVFPGPSCEHSTSVTLYSWPSTGNLSLNAPFEAFSHFGSTPAVSIAQSSPVPDYRRLHLVSPVSPTVVHGQSVSPVQQSHWTQGFHISQSTQMRALTCHGKLHLSDLMDTHFLPLIQICGTAKPATWSVLKISGFPDRVTTNEIHWFIGAEAGIIQSIDGQPVHLIRDRSTGETTHCYIEYQNLAEAKHTMNKLNRPFIPHYLPRLGRRPTVELSSQAALMQDLFPRAKGVVWNGQEPQILPSDSPYDKEFHGFITQEEIYMIVKHAQNPKLYKYHCRTVERPYERFISIMSKFPWWEVDKITVATRDELFWAAQALTRLLTLKQESADPHLGPSMLREMVRAAVRAPGFNEWQKAQIVDLAGIEGTGFGLSAIARYWPFTALAKHPDAPDDVVELYASLLARAPILSGPGTYDEIRERLHSREPMLPFGSLREYMNKSLPEDMTKMTLKEASELEFAFATAELVKVGTALGLG